MSRGDAFVRHNDPKFMESASVKSSRPEAVV
jgi:hypothetical protein